MGFYDRDYYRNPGNSLMNRLSGGSVVVWLLGINFVVFLLDSTLTGSQRGSSLSPSWWGNFNIEEGIFGGQIWRLITYQFLHAGFVHLLGNMIVVYFFGPLMERWWGSRRFIAFYLLCGMSGGVLFTLIGLVAPGLIFDVAELTGQGSRPEQVELVGASGSIFGILVGCAVLYPHQRVMLLIPPIPMSMRTLALVVLGIAALSVLAGAHNAGGEAAHLGGAALGFFLVKNARWLDIANRVTFSKPGAVQDNRRRRQAEKESRRAEKRSRKEKSLDAEVDRVLTKVKQQGLHSLTTTEKKTLQRATDHQRNVG